MSEDGLNTARNVVGNHHLEEETARNAIDPFFDIGIRHRMAFQDLWEEVNCTNNGTGDELGKERQIHEKISQGLCRFQGAFIDVDGVAHALKSIKRDAERQYDRPFHMKRYVH
ncbi:MAG: hypothetical protein IPK19_21870 [Chloroflexi bacterium]|nr:hypothetical protein [Chloroflexota bacterium]